VGLEESRVQLGGYRHRRLVTIYREPSIFYSVNLLMFVLFPLYTLCIYPHTSVHSRVPLFQVRCDGSASPMKSREQLGGVFVPSWTESPLSEGLLRIGSRGTDRPESADARGGPSDRVQRTSFVPIEAWRCSARTAPVIPEHFVVRILRHSSPPVLDETSLPSGREQWGEKNYVYPVTARYNRYYMVVS
jgi:hypothetical protein